MPTQQLVYEGTDLQALIQRVVDEHGPARIRPPERRRKGGVLGFFAKEVYVIAVDPQATERAAGERPAPAGAKERAGTSPATQGWPAAGRGSALGGSLAALVESTEDDLSLGTSRLAPADGRMPPAPPAPPVLPAPPAASRPAAPTGEGMPPASSGQGPGSAGPKTVKSFSQVLSEVASSLGEEPGAYRPDPERLRRITRLVPPPVAEAAPAPPATAPATISTTAPNALAKTAAAPPPATTAPAGATAPAAPAASPPAETAAAPVLDGALLDVLRAAGLPEGLVDPALEPAPGISILETAFAALPEAPPLPAVPGALVAVVGDARHVRPVAGSVASVVGCPAAELAVAARGGGPRHGTPAHRVGTPEQAATLAPGWRRGKVAVVAVYAPPLGEDQRWTRAILAALQPSCVWAMASATTKPDDVRRFTDALGGVDALALTDVTATATPAAVLSTGLPVACLDGEPATPARWAAVVAGLVARG